MFSEVEQNQFYHALIITSFTCGANVYAKDKNIEYDGVENKIIYNCKEILVYFIYI